MLHPFSGFGARLVRNLLSSKPAIRLYSDLVRNCWKVLTYRDAFYVSLHQEVGSAGQKYAVRTTSWGVGAAV